jgi:hypothetical protein
MERGISHDRRESPYLRQSELDGGAGDEEFKVGESQRECIAGIELRGIYWVIVGGESGRLRDR